MNFTGSYTILLDPATIQIDPATIEASEPQPSPSPSATDPGEFGNVPVHNLPPLIVYPDEPKAPFTQIEPSDRSDSNRSTAEGPETSSGKLPVCFLDLLIHI